MQKPIKYISTGITTILFLSISMIAVAEEAPTSRNTADHSKMSSIHIHIDNQSTAHFKGVATHHIVNGENKKLDKKAHKEPTAKQA